MENVAWTAMNALLKNGRRKNIYAMIASKRFSVAKLTNRQTSDSTEQCVEWECCPVNVTTSKVGKKAGGATLRHTKQNHKVKGVSYRHRLDTPCL